MVPFFLPSFHSFHCSCWPAFAAEAPGTGFLMTTLAPSGSRPNALSNFSGSLSSEVLTFGSAQAWVWISPYRRVNADSGMSAMLNPPRAVWGEGTHLGGQQQQGEQQQQQGRNGIEPPAMAMSSASLSSAEAS